MILRLNDKIVISGLKAGDKVSFNAQQGGVQLKEGQRKVLCSAELKNQWT